MAKFEAAAGVEGIFELRIGIGAGAADTAYFWNDTLRADLDQVVAVPLEVGEAEIVAEGKPLPASTCWKSARPPIGSRPDRFCPKSVMLERAEIEIRISANRSSLR